eukprot:g4543.t1
MQQLFVENATLRESLLSFSSSLTQASSIVKASADVEGDKALQQILSSIRANAECAVPAVFTRLNASRILVMSSCLNSLKAPAGFNSLKASRLISLRRGSPVLP